MVMSTLRIVVTVIYCIICIALAAIVLLQEGKQQGLGSIGGMADTYWGKNKRVQWKVILTRLPQLLPSAL